MTRSSILRYRTFSCCVLALLAGLLVPQVDAQTPEPSPLPVTEAAPAPGKVLFSAGAAEVPATAKGPGDHAPGTPVTDVERGSARIISTDLDLHLTAPHAEAQATLTIRNVSSAPLVRIPLQLTSALHWQSITSGGQAVAFTQSPIATDADHTGYAQEAVLTPAQPLAPDTSLTLTVFYAGDLRQSAARLELLGTPADRAALVDWDQAGADLVALRGFGNVLWYPVAAPTALLGDANRLFEVIGQQRLQQAAATFHLRLTVEYIGEAPHTVIFNGQARPLDKLDDTQDSAVVETRGVATAEFAMHPVGFRSSSLFVVYPAPKVTGGELLSVATNVPESVEPLAAAAATVQPLLQEWLGSTPRTPLTVLDHPGQPFEDDALLVTPLAPDARAEDLEAQAAHGLAHSWLRSSQPWINEGLAQYMSLLWIERKSGREAVVGELQHASTLIALAEPDLTTKPAGESSSQVTDAGQTLIRASAEVFYRTKAAAVFWQLRQILGDDTLKQALQSYRKSELANPGFDADPKAFQLTLEKVAKRDLSWFFDDWVYRDRSLPDLNIVSVSPRPLPDRPGKNSGYLVAVEVRNEGEAVAEVPVTVRNGTFTATERLRIPGGAFASTRILFEGAPDEVLVNDGTVPELRNTIHTRQVQIRIQGR